MEHVQHNTLHPSQEQIGAGSKWVNFILIDQNILQFGDTLSMESVLDLAVMDGAADDELHGTASHYIDLTDQGYVYAQRYDRLHPTPLQVVEHRSHIWPISDALFEVLRNLRFDHRHLGQQREMIDEAFSQFIHHVGGRS